MDSNQKAQNLPFCDLCKTATVLSYCDFCHVNLCKLCIGEHISNEYDKHKIVSFQQRKSTLIYPKCGTHLNKACEHQCNECSLFVCSLCTASKQHKGHEFTRLEDLYRATKRNIQKDAKELEQILPVYEDIADDLENQIANLEGQYEELTREISKHKEELYRVVDAVANQMQKEIDTMKSTHRSILEEKLVEMKKLQAFAQQSVVSLRAMNESNEVSPTIEYISKNNVFSDFSPTFKVAMPKFIPAQIDRETLCGFYGNLIPLSTTLENGNRIRTEMKRNFAVGNLLDEPDVLKTINTGHKNLRCVTYLNEEIWTSGETSEIKCFNIQGLFQKTIKTKSGVWPYDMVVDSDGSIFYTDWKTGTVNKVKNDQVEEVIRLQGWVPINLCITSSGDLLVTMCSEDNTQSKVVRYSGATEIQTVQFDEHGQSLYSGCFVIKYIAENGNLDICVADTEAGAVVVVNQAGKLRFKYTGHPSLTKNELFLPRGITTDTHCRILIADCRNHCIHILDENGEFLRYIDNCELRKPFDLCLDNNENLIVCEYERGNVKKIRYQQ